MSNSVLRGSWTKPFGATIYSATDAAAMHSVSALEVVATMGATAICDTCNKKVLATRIANHAKQLGGGGESNRNIVLAVLTLLNGDTAAVQALLPNEDRRKLAATKPFDLGTQHRAIMNALAAVPDLPTLQLLARFIAETSIIGSRVQEIYLALFGASNRLVARSDENIVRAAVSLTPGNLEKVCATYGITQERAAAILAKFQASAEVDIAATPQARVA